MLEKYTLSILVMSRESVVWHEQRQKFARLPLIVLSQQNLFTMIGDIVQKSGGNPHAVLEAIGSDSRVGLRYLGYGYGYGGPCFPRDNRALSIYATILVCPRILAPLQTDQ